MLYALREKRATWDACLACTLFNHNTAERECCGQISDKAMFATDRSQAAHMGNCSVKARGNGDANDAGEDADDDDYDDDSYGDGR